MWAYNMVDNTKADNLTSALIQSCNTHVTVIYTFGDKSMNPYNKNSHVNNALHFFRNDGVNLIVHICCKLRIT